MSPGRLFLLPSLLAEGTAAAVLPARVIEVARTTRHFLAENAKSARAFLKTIGHPVALQEIDILEIGHAPDAARIDDWLRPLRAGLDIALVSEAGCPAIADPGANVVARAHELGFDVKPLVGPSSILLALMASGLEGQRFRFVGYLPQDAAGRATAIAHLETQSRASETQIFIETPYRNDRVFDALLHLCSGDTRLTVAAELTGQEEFVKTRSITRWRELSEAQRPSLRNKPAVFALLATPGRVVRKR